MNERLQRALERIEGLPEPVQERVAELLERFTEALTGLAGNLVASTPELPDHAAEPLFRWQRESMSLPPMDQQLAWLDMGPDE